MTSIITTPIFYANGEPHLGHAYSGIIADILHQFALLQGQSSVLITGTDEHGQKIAQAAKEHDSTVHDFVDAKSQSFAKLWPELNISPDVFVRTTSREHAKHVSKVWQALTLKDDLYLGRYSGEYCVGCEQFYPQRDLNEHNLCPIHKKPLQTIAEETYLFRLENYRLALLDYYQSNPKAIVPNHFQQEVIKLLTQGPLEDLSVSRVNNQWGIPVPDNEQHTIYVWIDALFSYLTAMHHSGLCNEALADVRHVLGKDILKFHAIYWPAFLLALDLPLPKQLVVHGWWTIEGHKISKSIPETTRPPTQFSDNLSNDGLRYALVRQKPLYRDGNLAQNELKEVINADLANNLANLVKRNHTLVLKHFCGKIDHKVSLDNQCQTLRLECEEKLEAVVQSYQNNDLYQVALRLQQILTELNGFFHTRAPWLLGKGQAVAHVQNTCLLVSNILREIAFLYAPMTPQLSKSIISELGQGHSSLLAKNGVEIRDLSIANAKSHFQRV